MTGTSDKLPLLCFSHLRWDFVWQRPQHLFSRFARDRKVLFVEEPIHTDEAGQAPDNATMETRSEDGLVVCRPICRQPGPDEGWRLEQMYARLVSELVAANGLTEYVAWFYSPMFMPALEHLRPSLVVYDAMDELSLFKGAPPELLPRERRLLEIADVVFTGGVSLGKAKAKVHSNVHPFPSGVDAAHYRTALDAGTRVPDDVVALPRPRIGFFGVIDERIDLQLLAEVADMRPGWQLVMLGPVVKIAPEDLPQRPNLHYLGQKHYRDLPGYVKGFDVCMMPFALNDATKFISPTKTLEYMAAHKPIVSTPVADVVGPYGGAVGIAGDAASFVREVEGALDESAERRAQRIEREKTVLAASSWDSIAARMDEKMAEALQRRATGR